MRMKRLINNINVKKSCVFLLFVIISCTVISSFYFVFKTDEEITMGLVLKKFNNIISTDSLDVHPPLYYLLLNIFLLTTTFWTKSIFIKVIFARLFSIIFLIFSIIYMRKILKICNIRVNSKYQILFLLIFPGIINESTKIRMYAFATFIVVFELYQLFLFIRYNHVLNIILATIFAIIAFYTFYPLIIIVGLFILILFFHEIVHGNKNKYFCLGVSGIIVIVSYLPWIKILLKQFEIHSTVDGDLVPNYFYIITSSITQINAPSPTSPLLKYTCFISLFVIAIFFSLITISFYSLDNKFLTIMYLVLADFFLSLILIVIFCRRQFRLTTIYPIYFIFIFLLIYIIMKNVYNKHIYYLVICLLVIFSLYSVASCVNNVIHYDIPSIVLVKNFHKWSNSSRCDINIDKPTNIKTHDNILFGNATYVTQDSLYLKSLGKKAVIIVPNKCEGEQFIANLSNDSRNYKLFHELFPNLIYKCHYNK